MIVAITGGRYYIPPSVEIDECLSLLLDLRATELHHGASGNVDLGVSSIVRYLCPDILVRGWPVDTDPSIDGPWPAAGYRRNRRMLVGSKCQKLIAFSGNRGTKNCRETAEKLKITVHVMGGRS